MTPERLKQIIDAGLKAYESGHEGTWDMFWTWGDPTAEELVEVLHMLAGVANSSTFDQTTKHAP